MSIFLEVYKPLIDVNGKNTICAVIDAIYRLADKRQPGIVIKVIPAYVHPIGLICLAPGSNIKPCPGGIRNMDYYYGCISMAVSTNQKPAVIVFNQAWLQFFHCQEIQSQVRRVDKSPAIPMPNHHAHLSLLTHWHERAQRQISY